MSLSPTNKKKVNAILERNPACHVAKLPFEAEDLLEILDGDGVKKALSELKEQASGNHTGEQNMERSVQANIYHRILHEAFYKVDAKYEKRYIGVEVPHLSGHGTPDFSLMDDIYHRPVTWIELKEYLLTPMKVKDIGDDCKKMLMLPDSVKDRIMLVVLSNPELYVEDLLDLQQTYQQSDIKFVVIELE